VIDENSDFKPVLGRFDFAQSIFERAVVLQRFGFARIQSRPCVR